jgi:hypothetical protein
MASEWIFSTVGWLLGMAGAALAAWALFWDRSRGRRRCPNCWYDMSGAPGLQYSECGHRASMPRNLCSTRRRYDWLAVALAMALIAYSIYVEPRCQREGWFGALPSSALVWAAPVGDRSWETPHTPPWRMFAPPKASLIERLMQRGSRGELWAWQSRVLVGRIFQAHPNELAHLINVPERWPVDTPLYVRVEPYHAQLLFASKSTEVFVRLHGSGLGWAESNGGSLGFMRSDLVNLGVIGVRSEPLMLDVELRDHGRAVGRGTISSPIRIEGALTDYLKPLPSSCVDQVISECRPGLFLEADSRAVFLMEEPDGRLFSEHEPCTIAIRASILRDDRDVGHAVAWFQNIGAFDCFDGLTWALNSTSVVWQAAAPADLGTGPGTWELVLTPEPGLAMWDYLPTDRLQPRFRERANRFWSGRIRIPLAVDSLATSASTSP